MATKVSGQFVCFLMNNPSTVKNVLENDQYLSIFVGRKPLKFLETPLPFLYMCHTLSMDEPYGSFHVSKPIFRECRLARKPGVNGKPTWLCHVGRDRLPIY